MKKLNVIGDVILLLFIVTLGIAIGGGLYEARVLVPLWSASPPDSLIAYHQHNAANAAFVPNQGGRFWIFVTPVGALLALATLLSSVWTVGKNRTWRIAAATISLGVYVATFFWFVPGIMRLMSSDVMIMHPDEIANLTNWWVRLNWVRAALLITAWLAALRALNVSPRVPA